jgi:hypothetical protein
LPQFAAVDDALPTQIGASASRALSEAGIEAIAALVQ